MLRMEIALFFVLAFVAYMYYSAGRKNGLIHKIFGNLLLTMLVHLCMDAVTIYTVNHLAEIPMFVNDLLHRLFIGTMILAVYLFYRYIAVLVETETGKPRRLDLAAKIYLVLAEIMAMAFPIYYQEHPAGNYSTGVPASACYASVVFYILLCAMMLAGNWPRLESIKKKVIAAALVIEGVVCALQAMQPTWLISGMGFTLMTLAFYLTLENPAILRAELTEQKMSMLYLKSQVNPHFLYNTLDTIRIQAQLNGDKEVATLLLRLADFFRLSVKVDRSMVTLDDELELLEAYMDLICYRYPNLQCVYDLDPNLGGARVPNFILQPVVENSVLHGLKNKGYQGEICISAKMTGEKTLEIAVRDTGSGFSEGKKEYVDKLLQNYEKQPAKLEGNSIGILNVQKRIKLLCGRAYGLSYTENEKGGVTAHLNLPLL